MSQQKLNLAIGRFQPFTQGHLNMINEGEAPCIIYRINSSGKIPETIKGWKVGGRVIKSESIKKVINYIDTQEGDLTEQEKELLKRPFTNELINEELEIVKKNNKNIIDVVPVTHVYDALGRFNAFITEHQDEYEVGDWMCGDDRKEDYEKNVENLSKYDELESEFKSGKTLQNILIGKLKVNTGKGRTEGVSGTEVRKSILTNNKSKFESIMPKGVGSMFDKFVNAFNDFKEQLQGLIKENKILKNYINNNMKLINEYISETKRISSIDNYINEELNKYFTEEEKGKILKDMWDKNGEFYKMLKEINIKADAPNINQYFDDLLDDDRMLAGFAEYISKVIERNNFSLEQVRKFVQTEDLKG